jgi:hypothetical protein
VHNALRQTRQSAQRSWMVKIAEQRGDALCAQQSQSIKAGAERQHVYSGRQGLRHAQANIATTDDQDASAAKTRRQRARAAGVQNRMKASV